MPSFDIVSDVDMHELTNAIDQANREITTRYDFRDADANFSKSNTEVQMTADTDFQLTQMLEMLKTKMIKRNIDIKCLEIKEMYPSGKQVKQEIVVRQGLEKEQAKKISKMVKDAKLNVQPAIQGNQVRITGKKRDDLQAAIALLKKADLDMPLQYSNFRD
ncbi:MAG: YajQ family cyclic di-GMP-binding protein [Candidatus Endonucleobacter sp. (ex Gigantidas childressi)]|nr:YajQ family cyclic di-GMP-binding protein [Candidatus Endonucleobacter sp. (ex Gigantidas childressi)]